MPSLNQSAYPASTQRACRLSGVDQKLLRNRLPSLRDGQKLLRQSIIDSETALSDHEKWRALELGARSTLMVCDILMVGLEAMTGAAGPMTGAAGAAVAKLYDGSKLVADAALSGQLDPSTGTILLAKNKAKVTELAAKGVGKTGFAKALDLTMQLVGYGEALWGFVAGTSGMASDGSEGIRAGIQTARHQLERIERKIGEIENPLQACESVDAIEGVLLT
ncbi:MAG: hypothetical protein H6977_14580 [Gammaproteobacteria bacterium]|nr:hypothetical protein [Gammaproteobacteria bacterium]